MDQERRSGMPGRREYDLTLQCPFHDGICREISTLWNKSDIHAEKVDLKDLNKKIETMDEEKMDKNTFWKMTGIATLALSILITVMGWLLIEAYANNGKISILVSNQEKLMTHFKLTPILDKNNDRD